MNKSLITVSLLFALGAHPFAGKSNFTASKSPDGKPSIGSRGMVSTAHPIATQAGLEILAAGGNAFDAAVAIAATLNVVEPMMSGMGGYGATLIYDAGKREARFLDSSGRIPATLNSDVFRPPTPDYLQNRKGSKAVSTPGNVNAWQALSRQYGKLAWNRLFKTAIKVADDGFVISERTAGFIKAEFEAFSEYAKSIYGRDGGPLKGGDRLIQKDLARSLELVSAEGAAVIQGGKLGMAIEATMRDTRGFVTLEDLKNNRAEWWTPISIDYRGYRVVTASAPTNAWNGLLRLGIMSRFDVASLGAASAPYLHRYAEATKLAYAARLRYAGDPDVSPPPLDYLLSEKYWATEAGKIDSHRVQPFNRPGDVPPKAQTAEGAQYTTHFVVADRWGNIVCSTQTLGDLFGSKVMVRGTGIWLNDSLSYSTFEPKGNPMDAFPGRRKLAGFCPVIVMRDGRPWIAIGTPGGHTIVQTVPEMVINIIDFKMDIQQSINAPRLSFAEPDRIVLDGVAESVRKELAAMGHNVVVGRLGNAHGLTIEYDRTGTPSRFIGGSDPRGEGAAIGY